MLRYDPKHACIPFSVKTQLLSEALPGGTEFVEKRYYERAAGNKTGSLMLSSKWKQNPSGFYKELEHDSDPQQQGYHKNRRSVFGF